MKISRNWLREYVATDQSAASMAETLTMGGLEVDGIEQTGQSLEGVVVGRVERVRPHPNADRLVLCDVALGEAGAASTGTEAQIACGAPNVAEGQHVPVATLGTELLLPSDETEDGRAPVTIEAVELRGERSEGMICSAYELGIGADASGILVLEDDATVGQPLEDYLAARDTEPSDAIFDIDLTPNRPDATSHIGVARDLAALTDTELEWPEVTLPSEGGETADAVSVEVENPEACPRYAALLVRGVEVAESPAWLQRRLTAIGLQPRNAVVDVTNFVMHECGQPLHAFDFDHIAGDTIVVRTAEGETPFTTLDGVERTTPAGTLLICDAEKPVALAGLMGGQNSEVSEQTTDVLIESAYFDPSTIRRAAKALEISTDASYRFERGVDRDAQVWAAARAAHLIAELTGGDLVPGLVDAHPQPPEAVEVVLRPARANAVLGTDLSTTTMTDLLAAVGVETEREDPLEAVASQGHDPQGTPKKAMEGRAPTPEQEDLVLHCTVPSFRPDITREEDLIEEVARLHGYDHIPAPAHVPLPARPPREEPTRRLRRQVRQRLAGMGLREIQTNSMLPTAKARAFLTAEDDTGDVVETLKPISEAMAALRPRLLPGALETMRFNQNRGQDVLRFFEFGHVFQRSTPGTTAARAVPGYAEHEALLIALGGPAQEAGWDAAGRNVDFYDVKGLVKHLLDHLRIDAVEMEPFGANSDPNFSYGLHLSADAAATSLGLLGKVKDEIAADFDLECDVFAAELHWEALAEAAAPRHERRYEPPRRFPAVERDLAVVVSEDVPAGAALRTIEQADAPLLDEARLFDLYAGEGIAEGHKSLAFALRFQADRTLEDEEVDAEVNRIVSLLREEYDAELRQ